MLVRCTICNEVFDDSLKVCPVCGATEESFVKVESQSVSETVDSARRFVILGGGSAGFNAALAIREIDKSASVAVYSREAAIPYNRPMLTKALLGSLKEEDLAIVDRNFYKEKAIDLYLNKEAFFINRSEKYVVFKDSSAVYYDKLIYALGAKSFVPPIVGVQGDNVFTIRELEDAIKLKKALGKARKAVVIGGGVLGLEAAWSLSKAGLKVTVLDSSPILLAGRIEQRFSEALQALALKHNVEVKPEAKTVEITDKAVRLADSTSIDADIVIVSTGVRANVGLALDCGLEVNRGVVVDRNYTTSDPDIYSCGDCAIYNSKPNGLWSGAVEQGKGAGKACASGSGPESTLKDMPMLLKAFDTTLFNVGHITDDSRFENFDGNLCSYYFEGSRLVGATLLGDVGKEIAYVSRTMGL